MDTTIRISTYTATWDEAMRPSAPEIGTRVLIREDRHPDGREIDSFRAMLARSGLHLDYVDDASEDDGSVWSAWEVREQRDSDAGQW